MRSVSVLSVLTLMQPKMPRLYCNPPQMGEACEMRYSLPLSSEERQLLHQIAHSGDTYGPFAHTPNEFRDLTRSYDPKAQEVLDAIREKYQ